MEELKNCVAVMTGEEYLPAIGRMQAARDSKIRLILSGSNQDERNRGWVEALEWVLRMPQDMRLELKEKEERM